MIYKRLVDKRGHYTIRLGWLEYIKDHPDGWQKSQFYTHFKRWEIANHPESLASAPVEREPGKYLYID